MTITHVGVGGRPAMVYVHDVKFGGGRVFRARDVISTARTSSFCTGGSCVGVADTPHGGFAVVDTKSGETLRFSRGEWVEFVAGVKNGEFDAHG